MNVITNITSATKQRFILNVNQSENAILQLFYLESQLAWYMDLEYVDFLMKGLKLALAPNLIRAYKNRIPFGLMVFSEADDGIEAWNSEAFSSGTVRIGILDEDEVKEIEYSIYKAGQ